MTCLLCVRLETDRDLTGFCESLLPLKKADLEARAKDILLWRMLKLLWVSRLEGLQAKSCLIGDAAPETEMSGDEGRQSRVGMRSSTRPSKEAQNTEKGSSVEEDFPIAVLGNIRRHKSDLTEVKGGSPCLTRRL